MGLFDKLKKKKSNDSMDNANIIADIFRTICGDKKIPADEIAECTSSPKEYAVKNEIQFSDRGISPDDTDTNTLMWIGCVNILIKNAYAAELDFKCELEDFIFNLGELTTLTSKNITLDENDFDADADITVWLSELDKQLAERKLCIGGIDIDSDSYVIFLTDVQTLEKLKYNANSAGHKIDYAKHL